MTESKKEWIGWYYASSGKLARRNYENFKQLFELAIANAPSTIKFTSPDIEKLEKHNKILKQQVEILKKAMNLYANTEYKPDQYIGRPYHFLPEKVYHGRAKDALNEVERLEKEKN